MKQLLNRMLIISLLLIAYTTQASNVHASPSFYTHIKQSLNNSSVWLKGALLAGGCIGTAFLLKWAYNYFFELSDLQEIEQALAAIEKATLLRNDIAFTYHNESAIIANTMNVSIAHKYNSEAIIFLLKPEITAKYTFRPFYNYVLQIERDLNKVTQKQQDLAHLKIRLFERKLRLLKSNNSTLTEEERASLIHEYTHTINKLSSVHHDIQDLHHLLREIRSYVVNTIEYTLEAKQVRIEELERENAHLQAQAAAGAAAAAHAYWSRPQEQTVTHIHVHQDEQISQNNCARQNPSSSSAESNTSVQINNVFCTPCSTIESNREFEQKACVDHQQTISANSRSIDEAHVIATEPKDPQVAAYEQFREEVMFVP